jgi:regulatory protein
MLARREHSVSELTEKLSIKGFELKDINSAVQSLIEKNLQSDERYSEMIIRTRFNQGKGPLKIRYELHSNGISEFKIDEYNWNLLAKEVRFKKFGNDIPTDYKDIAKQKRFLLSRGFNSENIEFAMKK